MGPSSLHNTKVVNRVACRSTSLLAVLIVVLFCHTLQAQQRILPSAEWLSYIDNTKIHNTSRTYEDQYYLLKVPAPLKREELQRKGIQVRRQLDALHYIVSCDKRSENSTLPMFTLYPANDLWKLSERLQAILLQADPAQEQVFVVTAVQGKSLRQQLLALGASVQVVAAHESSSTYVIRCSAALFMEKILPLPSLQSADLRSGQPREESRLLDANLSVNGINLLHHLFPLLKGQGMLISIKEQRYAPNDLDLLGRNVITSQEGDAISSHATEMATIIAGSAVTSLKSGGVAPAARVTSADFMRLLPDPDAYFQSNAIYLQNHSYGTSIENFYGAEAAAYDLSTLQNPKVLHVFSSGNSGAATPDNGPYAAIPGFSNLTGNYKQAKNILTVGALDTLNLLDPFVSKGPAYDGRVKPELVAYSSLGSSSAAALVTGAAALLQQAFLELYGEIPPAELLKAILLNSAEDVGPAHVDFLSGYGSLQAYEALELIQEERFITGTIAQGQELLFPLVVPADARLLKATLVWHDVPAPVNSSTALVNDLDLALLSPQNGASVLPWVLNTYPHADSLLKPAVRGVDRINNIEQITLENPAEGVYQLRIKAYDVSQGPQSFSLAYGVALADEFYWVYPTGSDNLPMYGENSGIVRWESTYAGHTGVLEYSIDGGTSWQLISDAVDLEKEYYQWQVPNITATALLRMGIAGNSYRSDSFVISRQLSPSVGFNCTDSLMISWPLQEGAERYLLYALVGDQLQVVAEAADTMLVLDKEAFPYRYYAVAPVLANDRLAARSISFDYTLQGVDCYLSNFLVDRQDEAVALLLTLGTSYQVEQVLFEQLRGEVFEPLAIVSPVLSAVQEYLHLSPSPGWNTYRARVIFTNGEEITTEPATLYYLQEATMVVFPNPLPSGQELLIYTNDVSLQDQPLFKLYNMQGQPVWEQQIFTEREHLLLPPLAPGMYLYTIKAENFSTSGKLVVY